MPRLLLPLPDLRERVWGGTRLGAPRRQPIGESWLAGPDNHVLDDTRTLGEIAAAEGEAFVGSAAHARTGDRFPLLAKLIDPTQWLSVQVHPTDEIARRLHGPDAVGKTESWFIIEASPDAELLLGVRDGVEAETVRAAIRGAAGGGATRVAPLLQRHVPVAGGRYFVPAGALHAVGPGALVFELQQASDLTYRVEDWGRPSTPDRRIHIEESLVAYNPDALPGVFAPFEPPASSVSCEPAIECDLFAFDLVRLAPGAAITRAPEGHSLHIVTALDPVEIRAGNESLVMAAQQAVVVPASVPSYVLAAVPGGMATVRVLVSRVP